MNEQHKYRATDKMSDLICDNYSLLMVMSRFGLSEADYPQTGSRAHEEKTRSCYAVGAKKALFYAALTAVLKGGNILIPIPLKSRFYCVTKNNLHP